MRSQFHCRRSLLALTLMISTSSLLANDEGPNSEADKLAAAKQDLASGNLESVSVLAKLLLANNAEVRLEASESLRRISGQDIGYFVDAPLTERRKGAIKWLTWSRRVDGQTLKLDQLTSTAQEMDLLDRADLSNWQAFDSGKAVESVDFWELKDGVLETRGGNNGYLRTTADYGNYVLSLQWRWPEQRPSLDSGVFTFVSKGTGRLPLGLETQLYSQRAGDFWMLSRFSATVDGRKVSSHAVKMEDSSEKPLGEWNDLQIIVSDGNLSVRVNGQLQNVAMNCSQKTGAIALQAEGSPIQFKNVKLLPLSD